MTTGTAERQSVSGRLAHEDARLHDGGGLVRWLQHPAPRYAVLLLGGASVGAFAAVALRKGEVKPLNLLMGMCVCSCAVLAWHNTIPHWVSRRLGYALPVARALDAVSFTPSIVLAMYFAMVLMRPARRTWVGSSVPACLAIVLIAVGFWKVLQMVNHTAILVWFSRRAGLVAGFVISVSAVWCVHLAVFRHENFMHAIDHAIYGQSCYSSLRGLLFYNSLEGCSHFGVHNSPLLIVALPVYAVFPSTMALSFLGLTALHASAVVMFILIRQRLPGATALLVTAAYLLHPAIARRCMDDFYPIVLLPALLLGVFLAFEARCYKSYLVLLVLALTVKETAALTVVAFGVYGFLTGRESRWWAPALLAGIAWFLITFLLIVPAGRSILLHHTDAGGANGSTTGLLRMAIANPTRLVVRAANLRNAVFLLSTLAPFLFVAVLVSKELLVAIPMIGVYLLSGGDHLSSWRALDYVPILFVAYAAFLTKRKPQTQRQLAAITLVIVLCAAPFWLHSMGWQRPSYREDTEKALRAVPPHASLICPENFMYRAANREWVLCSTYWPVPDDIDYVILNRLDERAMRLKENREFLALAQTDSHPRFRLVAEFGNILVMKNRALRERKGTATVSAPLDRAS